MTYLKLRTIAMRLIPYAVIALALFLAAFELIHYLFWSAQW